MTGRADRVKAELESLALVERGKVDRALRHCAETARVADETTGQVGQRWTRRVQLMRQRPGTARADWRNDQMTDGPPS